ncbi:MAG: ABC transporter permease [Acidobacteria bacterium]|nr:ABC transporter permease [Acidobacteriota bacterium]
MKSPLNHDDEPDKSSKSSKHRELEEELASHLQMSQQDRQDRGESPQQAAQSARREFGNVALVEHVTRDQWRGRWFEEFLQDLRFAIRTLRKNPGFATIAVLTLVLGIGANTAIFSIVNGVLLRQLPFRDPARLVGTTTYYPKGAFVLMRDQSQTMDVIANSNAEFNLTGTDLPVRLTGTSVSANWFQVLGSQAAIGRTFQNCEDQPGNDNVVVLSHSLWERRFGSDPNIIGRSIVLEGESRRVVGVMPADFRYPSPKTELWVPLRLDPRKTREYWGDSYMPITARLRPGATLEQARTEMATLRPNILAAFAWPIPADSWLKSQLVPLQESIVGDVRPTLLVLLSAVGLLLLIACANVANLLLARSAARQREIALRTALGASRWRIARQFVSESLLIAVVGGALGLLAAGYGLSILKATLPADMPRLADVTVDSRVFAFTAVLSILTGILFGLAPALGATRLDPNKALKTGGDRGVAYGSTRMSQTLVIAEVAISVVLVIGAGLLVKSLWNLSHSNPGFQPEAVMTARITPNQVFCQAAGRCQTFYSDLLDRVRSLPGVKNVAAVNGLPLSALGENFPSDVEGVVRPAGADVPIIFERVITSDYLRVMQIPLLQGRNFVDSDSSQNAQRVALITKSAAERFWPGQDPIGKHFKAHWMNEWWTVVGVVGDVRELNMTRNLPEWIDGEVYTPYGPHAIQGAGPEAAPAAMTLVVLTSGDQAQLAGELEKIVSGLQGDVPVTQVELLHQWVQEAVSGPRSTASLFAIFATLALALGAIGIYGVISYSVSQRTREVGIRMALGARRTEVLRLVVGQGTRLALIGVAAGLAGALALTRLMASLLYGVRTTDPLTYSAVAVLLMIVAVAASYLPARRAMQVDPIIALRYE